MFRKVTREVGCAIIGQTAALAPADKRFYGIRDVTATVESIPLITASILSKKLAAGLQGLAMDVKFGSGAFMDTFEGAEELARSLADVATGAGLPTTALLTAMDSPLGSAAGNAVEVAYAIDYLTGRRREARMHEVTVALGAEMLLLGRLATDLDDARRKIDAAITHGRAAEIFQRMVSALGGPSDLVERPEKHLGAAPIVAAVPAEADGFVAAVDTRALGLAVVALGGGRTRAADPVDPAVGLTGLPPVGAVVARGQPLAMVHARTHEQVAAATAAVRAAYRIAASAPAEGPMIARRIEGKAA